MPFNEKLKDFAQKNRMTALRRLGRHAPWEKTRDAA
jgi:hypothetical protein